MARPRSTGVRERILEVAEPMFVTQGIREVGMQQVIDAAGCGKSLLYREFESKDDLAIAVLEGLRESWIAMVRSRVDETERDPVARLLAYVELSVEQVTSADYQGCIFRRCTQEAATTDTAPGRLSGRHLDDHRAKILQLTKATGVASPTTVATQIWLVVEGMYAAATLADRRAVARAGVSLVRGLLPGS